MKFRLLSNDELSFLEEELKAFLIVNGIDGPEWEKINKETPDKAVGLVEIFSDEVLQKVYSKIEFVEFRSPKTVMVFKIGDTSADLISLQVDENSSVDLSTPESIHSALQHKANEIQFFKQFRLHTKSKEEEIHLLLENGCVPSVEEFWLSLKKITSNESKSH